MNANPNQSINGHFVISLDYELRWGIFDACPIENYRQNLKGVSNVIPRLVEMADKYDIKLTFATVGFMFAKDKEELIRFSPENKPTYRREKFSPYPLIDTIGISEADDPLHYAYSDIKHIKDNGNHEISTHTYCHYYCHEIGQTVEQFEDDIKSAVAIAKHSGIEIKSIVFPRNMVESNLEGDIPYLEVCKKYGIESFRGNQPYIIYDIYTTLPYHDKKIYRVLRLLDSYFKITSHNTYNVIELNKGMEMINIPASAFLRPYYSKFNIFESLKILRIKKAMRNAAKKGELFHLWWHPHNFGTYTDKNFENLEVIFKEYRRLNKAYSFKSETMTSLAQKIKAHYQTLAALFHYSLINVENCCLSCLFV
jgi:peptidoglycan/xylan/chitin deacetylase (PgdA/CDA1 family)